MEKRWTDAQLSAIGANNKKILVSAAAGSGKTATLIERIIRSLTVGDPPLDINRMLIVTFTKAAASELRLRIMSAINKAIDKEPESKHLKRQLLMLESAEICTIDSFCLNVLRNEFHSSGNDANFKIGDTNELNLLKTKSMDDAVEQTLKHFSKDHPDALLEFFSVLTGPRRDKELSKKLLSIRNMLKNTPKGIEYIRDAADSLAEDAVLGDINERAKRIIFRECEYLFEHLEKLLSGYLTVFKDYPQINAKYGPAAKSDLEHCTRILNHIKNNSFTDIQEALKNYKYPRIGILKAHEKTPASEAFVNQRTAYKKSISTLKEKYFDVNSDDIRLINDKSSSFLSILYQVFHLFDEIYSKAKGNAHILEFDDLKSGVYKLFVSDKGEPTQLAREYSSKYDIIYIDEYQDVDPIQDAIFNALSVDSKLFMVGDIKQSIYGFRGSDSSIFGALRKSFDSYEEHGESAVNAAIYMSNNFRCSEPIIDASNYVCSHLFYQTNNASDSVGYTKNDDLVFSKSTGKDSDKKCEFVVVDQKPSDDGEKRPPYEAEVKYIASRITEIINNELKEDGTRFDFSDFAVLCDKNDQVSFVSNALKKLGIPCDEAPMDNFFSSPEILLLRSLLSAIDNPFSDIHFASVLLSPIFEVTDEECLKIRCFSDEATLYEAVCNYCNANSDTISRKCKKALAFLSEYSGYASTMNVSDFMTLLWNRADINAIASLVDTDGRKEDMRRDNIEKLYGYALAYSAASFKTLHTFLDFLNDIIEVNPESDVLPTKSADKSNRVHTMTLHSSKGLEFPVCFIFCAGANMSGKVHDSEVVYDKDAGLCFDPAAKQGLVRIRSPYKAAAISCIKEKQILEKIRLLYVGMTRARERLIITATRTAALERAMKKYIPTFSLTSPQVNNQGTYPVIASTTYAEWILLSDPFAYKKSNMILKEINEEDIPTIQLQREEKPSYSLEEAGSEIKNELKKRFDFSYFSANALIPAKVSVSELSPIALDDPYRSIEESGEIDFENKPWFILGNKEASSTDRGTATHLFLQFADFSLCQKNGIKNEIKRLTNKGFIMPEHAEIINRDMLESFFKSEFMMRILSARKVWREQRFNLPFPAHLFTKEHKELFGDEYVLVQGVIDLILEEDDGRIILIDYKTDYVTDIEKSNPRLLKKKFSERYALQLSYYSLAIERMFGKKPDSVIIYSLSAEREISISTDPCV